jgi:hypothetical protein
MGASWPWMLSTVPTRKPVDDRIAAAHRRGGSGDAGLERGDREGRLGVGQVLVGPEPRELLALVLEAAALDEVGVRVLLRARPGPLAQGDRAALLGEVLAGEVARQVGRREDRGAVIEEEHQREGRGERATSDASAPGGWRLM